MENSNTTNNDDAHKEVEKLPPNCAHLDYSWFENGRMLYCSKCAGMSCHDVIQLYEPVSEIELLKKRNGDQFFDRIVMSMGDYLMKLCKDYSSPFLIISKCQRCKTFIVEICRSDRCGSILAERIFPKVNNSDLPEPNQDMSPECAKIYKEAADVFPISPRASAGLMRLCLQQFLVELGITGVKLDEQIKTLTRAGVPVFVQQYMDVCRVVGNSGVHPTVEMNVDEDPEIAKGLFQAMNIIVQHLITIPREAREAYDKLPKGAIRHIEQRDSKTSKK